MALPHIKEFRNGVGKGSMKRSGRKRLAMKERRVLVKVFAVEYRKAGKKEKGAILQRFVEIYGSTRNGARLLRHYGRWVVVAPGVQVEGVSGLRRRRRMHGEEVRRVLRRLWEMPDYPGGKRPVAALPARDGGAGTLEELEFSPQVRGGYRRSVRRRLTGFRRRKGRTLRVRVLNGLPRVQLPADRKVSPPRGRP